MIRFALSAALALSLAAPAARADEVTETIEAALTAYQAGEIQEALEELAYATQLIR